MKSDEGGGTADHASTSLFATVSQSQMGGGGVDVNKDAPKSSTRIPAARWPPPGSLVQTGAGPISARAGADRLGRSCCVGTGKQHRLCLRLQEKMAASPSAMSVKKTVGDAQTGVWAGLNAEDCAIEKRSTGIYQCTSLFFFYSSASEEIYEI